MSCLLFLFLWIDPQVGAKQVYVLADRNHYEPQQMEQFKFETDWWLELGDQVLFLMKQQQLVSMSGPFQMLRTEVNLDQVRLLPTGCGRGVLPQNVAVLAQSKRFAVVQIGDDAVELADSHGHQVELLPIEGKTVIKKRLEPTQPKRRHFRSVQNLVDAVDADRWFADVTQLASWNRYSRGTEIDTARDWLVSQFEAMEGLEVSTQEFTFSGTTAYNVIAKLTGTTRPDDWYIIGAHYDSISQSPNSSAPGAEDNASGTAAVLEMARIFTTNRPPEATILFIAYSGEEQGLHGSRAHVDKLTSDGDLEKLQSVLTMDMIAYSQDNILNCLLETRGGVGDALLPIYSEAAATYTSLAISTTTFAFGSDHIPYLDANIPTLLTIEDDYGIYPGYHRTNDLPENISLPMGREIMKMNVAVIADLAGSGVDDALFLQYADGWGFPPQDSAVDTNGNNRIDVTEIIPHVSVN